MMTTPASVQTLQKCKRKRGAGWKRAKRHRPSVEGVRVVGRPSKGVVENSDMKKHVSKVTTFDDLCDMLNSSNWAYHIYLEALGYKMNGMLDKARELYDITPISTYLEQNRATDANKAKYLCKSGRVILNWCAEATHLKNEYKIPFSIAARSVAKLARRSSSMQDWTDSANVVARKTAIKIVNGMARRRPRPDFVESPRIFLYVYDQVYRVADCKAKGGKSTAQPRVMGTGADNVKATGIESGWCRQVFVNWFRIPIPQALVQLNQEDLDLIRRVGPLTQGFDSVYPRLTKAAVSPAPRAPRPEPRAPRPRVDW